MAPSYSRPDSPRSVADIPVNITMLRVDNVLVGDFFYNLQDTMDRLDWLGDHYDSYDRFYCNLVIGTLTRIRNNRITIIDPFTDEYRMLHDPICHNLVAWNDWWERHGVRISDGDRRENEYMRLWARFRRDGAPDDVINVDWDLSDDDEDGGLATQASF